MSAGTDRMRESVQEHLDEVRRLFAPEVKVTLIARLPCEGGSYMLVSDDKVAEVAKLVQRHVSEEVSAAQGDGRLMPCPWCGDVRCSVERMDMVEGKVVVGHDDDNGPVYYVECMACLARGSGHDYALDAVAQWNTRATPPAPAPAAEAERDLALDDARKAWTEVGELRAKLADVTSERNAIGMLLEAAQAGNRLLRDQISAASLAAAAPEQPAQAKPYIKTYRITDDNLVRVEQPAQAKAVGDAGSGMIPSLVRRNAEKDPAYCPYCLRCDTACRMVKVGHMQWKCTACPAVHDERTPDERATPPAPAADHSAMVTEEMVRVAAPAALAENVLRFSPPGPVGLTPRQRDEALAAFAAALVRGEVMDQQKSKIKALVDAEAVLRELVEHGAEYHRIRHCVVCSDILAKARTLLAGSGMAASDRLASFLAEVSAEHQRATAKFPDPGCSLAALTEEAGEVAKAMLDDSSERVRKECVQLATMAARVALEGDPTMNGYRDVRGAGPHPVIGASL